MPCIFKNLYKNEKGFSLVEIIIAVAILALLSGPAIQAFFVSARLNQKSAQLDIAAALAASKIEEFKAYPEIYFREENKTKACRFYDKNWREINDENTAGFFLETKAEKSGSFYSLTITVFQKTPQGREALLTLKGGKYLPPPEIFSSQSSFLSINRGVA